MSQIVVLCSHEPKKHFGNISLESSAIQHNTSKSHICGNGVLTVLTYALKCVLSLHIKPLLTKVFVATLKLAVAVIPVATRLNSAALDQADD